MEIVCEINDETIKDLMDYIVICIDVGETLKLISENLYNSFENRKQQYPTNSINKSKLKAKCNSKLN